VVRGEGLFSFLFKVVLQKLEEKTVALPYHRKASYITRRREVTQKGTPRFTGAGLDLQLEGWGDITSDKKNRIEGSNRWIEIYWVVAGKVPWSVFRGMAKSTSS